MARRSDASLAALLLAQRLVDTAASPLSAREYWTLLDRVGDPAQLLGRSADDLAGDLDDPELAARVATRMDAATALAFELERLEGLGVQVVTSVDDAYPARLADRLGPKAPALLHVVGPVSLLAGDLLGVVGFRDVDPVAKDVAVSAGRAAVAHGWGVVSGGARGVDRFAMNAAVEAGGVAVGLLADALVRVTKEPELRRLVGEERVCLATPFAPTMGFTPANAMARNKLIYALGQRTLVVTSDHERGGTWSGAKEALGKGLGFEVGVWIGDGEGPGNGPLVARGARPIHQLEDLWVAPVESSVAAPAEDTEQLHLGV